MYKSVLVATAVGAAVLTTVATPHITFATSGDNDNTKVTVCHRTDAVNNPYVKITVSSNAAYGGHDEQHNGPVATSATVAQALKDKHVKWGDIIPADATHAGQNWTAEGKAIFNNNCSCPSDKTGPVVGPVDTKPGKGGDVTPASTGTAATPASTASTSGPTVSELPKTGAGSSLLIAGSIVSLLSGAAVYGGRFIRARFLPQL